MVVGGGREDHDRKRERVRCHYDLVGFEVTRRVGPIALRRRDGMKWRKRRGTGERDEDNDEEGGEWAMKGMSGIP